MKNRTNRQEDRDFTAEVLENIESDAMIAVLWVRHNCEPEDVFAVEDLEYWAEQNGYVKEGHDEH